MIFLVLLGKMIFPCPENMILNLRRKIKDDLSEKIHGNLIFFRSPEKMVFPEKAVSADDLSCTIWKDGIFFPKT